MGLQFQMFLMQKGNICENKHKSCKQNIQLIKNQTWLCIAVWDTW